MTMAINDKSIFVGDAVRLSGITRHGKNRIRENGDMWEVITIDGKDSSVLSTKICVVPMAEGRRENWRWLDLPEDEHMEIEIIDNEVVL
tara:strand:- start:128 stop:394 length:267 start_codon:yes stop_codon:yes gene_type:complete